MVNACCLMHFLLAHMKCVYHEFYFMWSDFKKSSNDKFIDSLSVKSFRYVCDSQSLPYQHFIKWLAWWAAVSRQERHWIFQPQNFPHPLERTFNVAGYKNDFEVKWRTETSCIHAMTCLFIHRVLSPTSKLLLIRFTFYRCSAIERAQLSSKKVAFHSLLLRPLANVQLLSRW